MWDKFALKILAILIVLARVASGIVIGAGSINNVSNVSLSSATICMPDDYAKIQGAVDNASDGETIIVRDGTYTENVDVKKVSLNTISRSVPDIPEAP